METNNHRPSSVKGVIFDIQRFAVHDGPGIRTTIFFKGCLARCGWCHNPESFIAAAELQYYEDRCTCCGKCVRLCPNGAHAVGEGPPSTNKQHTFDRRLCTACGLCAAECFSNALVISGREEGLEEVLRQVLYDKPFYKQSGGGVTLSGGEPVLQGDFCEALLAHLKDEGIHTNLQTAGFYPFPMLKRLLPHLDLVMYDIKGLSPAIFQNHIHADPSLAVENLKRLDETGVPFIVRTPCVKGVNDSATEIEAVAQMLSTLKNLLYYELLPYHGLARGKYAVLGKEFKPYEAPTASQLRTLADLSGRYVNLRS